MRPFTCSAHCFYSLTYIYNSMTCEQKFKFLKEVCMFIAFCLACSHDLLHGPGLECLQSSLAVTLPIFTRHDHWDRLWHYMTDVRRRLRWLVALCDQTKIEINLLPNLTFDLWFDLDIDQVSKKNSRNGLPTLNNPKKEVLHDHLGYQDEQLKMFHI